MNESDFETIANLIAQSDVEAGYDQGYVTLGIVANKLADFFETLDPEFDRKSFLDLALR